MNEKAAVMKKEIRAIASYRALMISKWLLSSALLIIALYLGIRRLPISPLYILLFLNALPAILTYAVNDNNRKSQNEIMKGIQTDDPFLLGSLKKKYKYTKLRYVSNSISYLVAVALISLWQYNYNSFYYVPANLKYLPVRILATGLAVRLLGIVFYRVKLQYDVSHNKV